MALRNFTAKPTLTNITTALNGTDAPGTSTTVGLTSTANLPAAPFTAGLDLRQGAEEVVLVTALAGGTATITRGYDGTAVSAHASGTGTFEHVTSKIDFAEANAHVNAGVSAGHGQVQTADIANNAVGQAQVNSGYVDLLQGQTVAGPKTFSALVTANAGVQAARGQAINMDGGTANTVIVAESTAASSFTGSLVSDLIIKEPNGQRILIGTHGASGVQNPSLLISSTDVQGNDGGTMRSFPRGRIGGAATLGPPSTTVTSGTTSILLVPFAAMSVSIVSGRRYRMLAKVNFNQSVANDAFVFSLLVGAGSAAPVAGSSQSIGVCGRSAVSGTTNVDQILEMEFVGTAATDGSMQCAAGSRQLGIAVNRASGTGILTVPTSQPAFCWIEDIGT